MNVVVDEADDSPEGVARAFLAALDGTRWRDATGLVHPQTLERFRSWWIHRLRQDAGNTVAQPSSDTDFVSAAAMLGGTDAVQAEHLSGAELLARFAAAVHPGNLLRHQDGGPEDIRITRTLMGAHSGAPDAATVHYRTEWWHGELRNEATAGVHAVELARTAAGWRVFDADLSGSGTGHILPPP